MEGIGVSDVGGIRFCGDCGARRAKSGTHFCTNCGVAYGADPDTTSPPLAKLAPAPTRRTMDSTDPSRGGARLGIGLAIGALVAVMLVGSVWIAIAAGPGSSKTEPTGGVSQVLLDYYSASGIDQGTLCSDIESGATFDGWEAKVAGQTGLSATEARRQTLEWCRLKR